MNYEFYFFSLFEFFFKYFDKVSYVSLNLDLMFFFPSQWNHIDHSLICIWGKTFPIIAYLSNI